LSLHLIYIYIRNGGQIVCSVESWGASFLHPISHGNGAPVVAVPVWGCFLRNGRGLFHEYTARPSSPFLHPIRQTKADANKRQRRRARLGRRLRINESGCKRRQTISHGNGHGWGCFFIHGHGSTAGASGAGAVCSRARAACIIHAQRGPRARVSRCSVAAVSRLFERHRV